MAALIPALSGIRERMSSGERILARCLESCLGDDDLCWYDSGPLARHAGFIVLHPRRGLLFIDVPDEEPAMSAADFMAQAIRHAQAVVERLERDARLVFSSGKWRGRLMFPWSVGVALAYTSRKDFEAAGAGLAALSRRVVCQDDMAGDVDTETFRKRLGGMFDLGGWGSITPIQIDRLRWHLFPALRLPSMRIGLPDEVEPEGDRVPDRLCVMSLAQERLARASGAGHGVIHGVAGSGKTLILGQRAVHLARTCVKPVLLLCYSQSLASRLERWMRRQGVADRVLVRNFHAWCSRQIKDFRIELPGPGESDALFYDQLVNRIIAAVDQGRIPAGQYAAVLIDEGHEFRPEWLRLAVRMVDPSSNELLLAYDDAQLPNETGMPPSLDFENVGTRASGSTARLPVNYRNTQEILSCVHRFSGKLRATPEAVESQLSLTPVSAGRPGAPPVQVWLPDAVAEGRYVAERLQAAHRDGLAWRDMAVLYRQGSPDSKVIGDVLRDEGIPLASKEREGFGGRPDKVVLMPIHGCKGLEFPLVSVVGMTEARLTGTDAGEEARRLHLALTRATEILLLSGVAVP